MAASTPMAHIATPRLAFPALILANIILALGPVLVRLADVGPVAAAFWRLAIAMPFLFILALPKLRKSRLSRGQWTIVILAGVCFAADLAADAMATEKLATGIEAFAKDLDALRARIAGELAA